jgi:HK97 family phage prohead protease
VTLHGRPIVFNSDSLDLGFIEVVRPQAMERTLREKTDVVALVGHDINKPLGRVSAGTLTLASDVRGVRATVEADERVSFAADVARIIDRKDAAGGSFAFSVIDDVWSLRDGQPHREILDMHVREVSLAVSFPAYPATAQRDSEAATRTWPIALARKRLALAVLR